MNVLDKFKDYKRDFILINRNTAILIHIFSKDSLHDLEDIGLEDHDEYAKKNYKLYKESAKQLFKQFEGNECAAFIKALQEECNRYLRENEKKIQALNLKPKNEKN